MAFFVVLRRADTALSIPLPEAFPTREAAIAALSAASAAGDVVLDGEVFIADLASAVPVLIMQPAVAPVRTEAVEPADEPGILDEVEAEAAYAEYSPLTELSNESSLAAALKRAASSLEDEGIVAPESVESAPEAVTDEETPAEEEPAEGAVAYEAPAEEQSWPWANVEAYTPPDAEADDVEPVAPEVVEAELEPVESVTDDTDAAEEPEVRAESDEIADPLGVTAELETDLTDELYGLTGAIAEPIVEDSPIITSAPLEGEDAYMPRPVILGDYADTASPAAESEEPEAAPEPSESEVSATAVEKPEVPVVDEAELSLGEPSDDGGDELSALVAEATSMSGYEGGGELNLAEYTCQDCIYANTCPKVGEATPANCGSFQWRSE